MNKEIEKIVDLLHWKEYKFVGQDNAILEGSLTQESEEAIATQILRTGYRLIPGNKELREAIREILLAARQYLCDTEFAPEPFTEPVDPEIPECL